MVLDTKQRQLSTNKTFESKGYTMSTTYTMAVKAATLRNEMRVNYSVIEAEIERLQEEAPINSIWDGRDIVLAAVSYHCSTGGFSGDDIYDMYISL